MAAIGTANIVMPAFRNSIGGRTADYTTRVNLDTDGIYVFFYDEGAGAADEGWVFSASAWPGSATTSDTNRLTLTGTTISTTNTIAASGFFDADDAVFTTGTGIASTTTNYEKLFVAKRQASTATDPLLYHFGTATGLAITPNGADITIVWNSSGVARH